jgi:hypothetical protein
MIAKCGWHERWSSKKLPTTVLEALLVGVGTNHQNDTLPKPSAAASRFKALTNHPIFSEEARKEGLSKKPKVIERMKKAIEIFTA